MKRSIRRLEWRGVLVSGLLVLGGPTLAWAQNNTFPASGNVGIGTSTPSYPLVVSRDQNATTQILVNNLTSGGVAYSGVQFGQNHANGQYVQLRYANSTNGQWPANSFIFEAGPNAVGGTIFVNVGSTPMLFYTSLTERVRITDAGNVGIGTGSPTAKLHVAGDVQVDGNLAAKYQDIAEWVQARSSLPSGIVVVVDPQSRNQVLPASKPYDTRVAGVVSARPGLLLGEAGESRVKVAHSGRVKIKVDASYGPIIAGDLLVTSPTLGHAMRSTPLELGGTQVHRPGTLLGKALESLETGQGEILVLLTLQ